jgi:hypothetical protein
MTGISHSLSLICASIGYIPLGKVLFDGGPNPNAMILHEVFIFDSSNDKCDGSGWCDSEEVANYYTSPFGCYFPMFYSQYGGDVYDVLLTWDRKGQPTSFQRSYYSSKDGSCQSMIEEKGYELLEFAAGASIGTMWLTDEYILVMDDLSVTYTPTE